jgi:hypothetical protein
MKRAYLAVISLLMSLYSFAQDKKVEIDIDKDGGGGFWGSPVVWVIGAAVFILLLVALLRGKSSGD